MEEWTCTYRAWMAFSVGMGIGVFLGLLLAGLVAMAVPDEDHDRGRLRDWPEKEAIYEDETGTLSADRKFCAGRKVSEAGGDIDEYFRSGTGILPV